MALTKRTRFILVQSTNNSNVTEDNMEPYHISFFRRSTSMPPLPRLSTVNRRRQAEEEPSPRSSVQTARYQRREKNEISMNKFNKLNIHAVKRTSARISRRLSSAFGLTTQTIDEQFNFQEQRFRALEKFLKLFLRNTYTCIEALRDNFLTKVEIADDFQELLIDKMPELPQQYVRLQRSLLENAFTEFFSQIETYVIYPINQLIKLFLAPSNLIAKRNKKLLDYDSAQSAYEKVKDQQLKQAKQVLDLSKRAYETLNNQLLEELPILYDNSCQILLICLTEYLRAHYRLMQQTRINIQIVLNQALERLNWQEILERFTSRTNAAHEQLSQLTITAKNFSEKLKNLSTNQISNLYNYEKETTYIQTDEIRSLIINRYLEKDLFIVNEDVIPRDEQRLINSRSDMTVRSGDLVGLIHQDGDELNWLVDNGVTRGYLPRSILIPFSSAPPAPIRQDIPRPPQPLPRSTIRRNDEQSNDYLINSSHYVEEENERIYLNQLESDQYATVEPNHQEQIFIALYDFDCTMNGVLSLNVGDRLKILRHLDDNGNEEWWYAEKLNSSNEKGYVPANYIKAI